MVLWANLHSSFILGLGLIGALGLEAALDNREAPFRTLAKWAGVGVACLLAALATPHGFSGLIFPVKVMAMKSLPFITEWRGPDFMKLEPVEIALLGAVFVFFYRGVRVPLIRLLVVLGLVHMTLQHIRQEVVLGVIAPLLLAEPLGRAINPEPAPGPWNYLGSDPGMRPRPRKPRARKE